MPSGDKSTGGYLVLLNVFCMIAHLVAAAENNVIGNGGKLPWHLPNDLKYFKSLTWGGVVIMGRKTYESVNKPLPGRLNIVITTNLDWKAEGVVRCSSIDEAIQYARDEQFKEIFVIGGGEIFNQTIHLADTIYLTRIHAEIFGDAHYPAIDESLFFKIAQEDYQMDEKHAFPYSFETWKRKSA